MTRMEQIRNEWEREDGDFLPEWEKQFAQNDSFAGKNADKLLEEAAAVFSMQGLKTLTNLVMARTEAMVADALEQQVLPKVEQMLEGKSQAILHALMKGMEAFTAHLQSQQQNGKQQESISLQQSPLRLDAEAGGKGRTRGKYGKTSVQAQIVAAKLREATRPVRLSELVKMTPEIGWTNNPHVKLAQIMKLQPQIKRTGFGMYQYQEIS